MLISHGSYLSLNCEIYEMLCLFLDFSRKDIVNAYALPYTRMDCPAQKALRMSLTFFQFNIGLRTAVYVLMVFNSVNVMNAPHFGLTGYSASSQSL